MEQDWTRRFFVEQADMFLAVMESAEMIERGQRTASCIMAYLRDEGLENPRILDIGCGTGRIAIPLACNGATVVGVDLSPRYVEIARAKAERLGISSRARFVVCDARRLDECLRGFEPFDVALFVWTTVIGYYDRETDVDILRRVRRVVKEDGYLIIAETASKDFISFLSNFVGGAKWFTEYGEYVVVEWPRYNPATGECLTMQLFYRKQGRDLRFVGEARFRVRLYSLDELVDIARASGWCLYEAFRSFCTREPYRTLGAINAVFRPC